VLQHGPETVEVVFPSATAAAEADAEVAGMYAAEDATISVSLNFSLWFVSDFVVCFSLNFSFRLCVLFSHNFSFRLCLVQ
jgi:hypothetical protein